MEKTKPRAGKDTQREPSATATSAPKAPLHSAASPRTETSHNGTTRQDKDTHSALGAIVKTDGISLSTETFVDLVNQGIQCWQAAGALLVTWEKQEPRCFQLILKQTPWLSIATLEMFRRIGKNEIHPKVLLLPPAQAERATRLSYDEQVKLCSGSMADASKQLRTKPKPRDYTPCERKLSDKLPTIGYFAVTLVNGVPHIHKTEKVDFAIPIVIDRDNMCYLQLLKP